MSGRELLAGLAMKHNGDFKKIYQSIKDREKFTDEEIKNYLDKIKSKYITILDDEYPEILKQVYMPPFVLFYHGDISLLKSEDIKVAVVGSRDCSEYGKNITKTLVNVLSKNKRIIVSGLARGIDSVAHEACLNSDGRTIAVLGSGINNCYPHSGKHLYEKIKKDHLVISEYPNDLEPSPTNFPNRNRIVAGIADKVLVTEAYRNSGTNITILFALRQGKDVLAVPYMAGKNSACNSFIQDGAFLINNEEDVLFYTNKKY